MTPTAAGGTADIVAHLHDRYGADAVEFHMTSGNVLPTASVRSFSV